LRLVKAALLRLCPPVGSKNDLRRAIRPLLRVRRTRLDDSEERKEQEEVRE
jgi:hypothetical protein